MRDVSILVGLAAMVSSTFVRIYAGPTVLFVGCDEVRRGSICEVTPPARITVWVEGAAPTAEIEGAPIAIESTAVHGGHRFAVGVDAVPAELILSFPNTAARFRIAMRRSSVHADLRRAEQQRRSGDFDDALALVEPLERDGGPADRAAALGELGRIAIAQGRLPDAIRYFEASIAQHHAAGAVWSEMDDRYALAYVFQNLGEYSRAFDELDAVDAIATHDSGGARYASFYRAILARSTGDLRRADTHGLRVLEDAERLGLDGLWRSAAENRTAALLELGRRAEARVLLDEIIQRIGDAPACAAANSYELAGRFQRSLAETPADRRRAVDLVERAATLYQTQCASPRRYAIVLTMMGTQAIDEGRLDDAAKALSQSRAASSTPGVPLRIAQATLDADLALASGRHDEAEAAYARLELIADLYQSPETLLLALHGRGTALERLARPAEAIASYRRAETLIEEQSLRVPIGAGRETMVAVRAENTYALIDLLLRLGRTKDAAHAARRSRIRALLAWSGPQRLERAPSETRRRWYDALSAYHDAARHEPDLDVEDWWLPTAEIEQRLQARRDRISSAGRILDEATSALGVAVGTSWNSALPAEGELTLLYHRVADGWVGFAINTDGVEAVRLGEVDTEDRMVASRTLLVPFDAQIASARRIRLLGHGALQNIDMHALPWRGRPLIASKPVVYGIDIPSPTERAGTDGRQAYVVAPYDTLPSSKDEAEKVGALLESEGWRVERLFGNAASHEAIETAFGAPSVDLVHYAGHGHYRGIDGWQSALGRPSSQLLSVPDILALPSVPRTVVLGSCEAAMTSAASSGLGLAQAFVLRGAEYVVAPSRPVRDADAAALLAAFYGAPSNTLQEDVPARLAAAQGVVQTSSSGADWASFRVIGR